MNRKSFIQKSVGALLITIPAYSLISCSGSDDSPIITPPPGPDPIASGNCLQNGTKVSISANHGHTLVVSKEDVSAGVEKTYELSAASSNAHIHLVTLTSADFNTLKTNFLIKETSTNDDSHTHEVTVSCA
jgi:hypothetical protein